MKATLNKPLKPEFKPFSVTIEFETQEEAAMFRDMFGYEHSIPKLMDEQGCQYAQTKENRAQLTDMMIQVRRQIFKGLK